MSEVEKTENCVMDSQESCCDNAEKGTLTKSQALDLSESQDFHLIDPGDEESQSTMEIAVEAKQEERKPLSPELSQKEEVQSTEIEPEIDKDKKEASKEPFTREETTEKKETEDRSNLDSEKNQSDDEEIIQCTPEVLSPSKKPVLKRKVESLDERPCKVLRTSSQEDALSSDRQRAEEESQSRMDMYGTVIEDSQKNIIIAETQDIAEPEDKENNKEATSKEEASPAKNVDEAIVTVQESKKEPLKKGYEIDKNENLSGPEIEADIVEDSNDNGAVTQEGSIVTDNNADKTKATSKEDVPTEKVEEKTNSEVHHDQRNVSVEVIHDAANSQKDQGNKENCINSVKTLSQDTNSKESQEAQGANEITDESISNKKPQTTCNSRMSIEVIYDKTSILHETKSKPKQLVEIDEDGEKIVLDSSDDYSSSDLKTTEMNPIDNSKADTTYKSCYDTKSSSEFSYKTIDSTKESSLDSKFENKLVNGSTETKRCDTDSTASVQSDIFNDMPMMEKTESNILESVNKPIKSKESEGDLFSVSENEPDVSLGDDVKSKSDLTHSSSLTKGTQIEKEINIYVRLKCLLHIDETTKEFISKEITSVCCDSVAESTLIRQKTNDTSASLADISGNDNKDGSPGSVNSNAQMYPLNPSRLSCASTLSSLSSVSSAASLAAKLALRDGAHFPLPRAPVKHAKKCYQETLPSASDKHTMEEYYERLTKEWQNSRLITSTVLGFANTELNAHDTYNISNERIDDQLQKIRSSTPEARKEVLQVTPKTTKKGKAGKRTRSRSTKAEDQSNGLTELTPKVARSAESSGPLSRKKTKTEHGDSTLVGSKIDDSTKASAEGILDELIGKEVFAKWSDNNYYPGTVVDKVKAKYKVNFYDGKSKVLIEDFVIPIPKTLNEGLSVYAFTSDDDYGSSGIITGTEIVDDEVYYLIESDEFEKLRVQVQNIFLSSDQAQILKEEISSGNKSVPTTPKHLAQVTLDNMVEGKRRSRRIATPKSRSGLHTPSKSSSTTGPSVSGIISSVKREKKQMENDGTSSDSNVSIKEETLLSGLDAEIVGTQNAQVTKGPQSRIKSKARSKKKEDEETIARLGPIPAVNSTFFKGFSFILTCASTDSIDRYQSDKAESESETATEPEEEWIKNPFVRERLRIQIETAGGIVYDEFSLIPQDQYKQTKLITNMPNTTAKALLCLSVGIPAYSHNWVIRCCQENKLVNPAEHELPAGWSWEKHSYIEMFQRPNKKPLSEMVIIIPVIDSEKRSISFWRQICENAGAVVLLAEKSESMEGFGEGTIVLANYRCPTWAVDKANELQIPLLSTSYIVACLIEGRLCSNEENSRYVYNYIKN